MPKMDKSEAFVNLLAGLLAVRGGGTLLVHERAQLEDAFNDAVDARIEAFWNEQHRTDW